MELIIGFIFVIVFFTFFGIKITIHGKDKKQSGGESVTKRDVEGSSNTPPRTNVGDFTGSNPVLTTKSIPNK